MGFNEVNDEFTGMDPALAKRNIDEFREGIINVEIKFCDAVNELFKELYYAWSSPKAVDFYNKYIGECDRLYTIMIQAEFAICQGAYRAYNLMARATGNETIFEDYGYDANNNIGGKFYDIIPLVDHKDGKNGMNINLVKNFILPAFQIGINGVLGLLDNIPDSIALYDADGSQSGAYATGIHQMKTEINSVLDAMKGEIISALETEVDNLLLAKTQSIDAMNNMNA